MECEGDDVVKQKIRVLQAHFASPHQDDEMLDRREVISILQTDAESKCLRLARSTDDEILEEIFSNLWHVIMA